MFLPSPRKRITGISSSQIAQPQHSLSWSARRGSSSEMPIGLAQSAHTQSGSGHPELPQEPLDQRTSFIRLFNLSLTSTFYSYPLSNQHFYAVLAHRKGFLLDNLMSTNSHEV